MEGYIKLYRKLIESPVFANEKLLKIWIWCLCKATHKDKEVIVGLQSIHVKKGQFICGLLKASDELKIPKTTLSRNLRTLSDFGMISLKTGNKWTLVTVENWDKYQCLGIENGKQMGNERETNGKQMGTNKNVKNDKNDKEYNYSSEIEEIVTIYNRLCISLPTCTKVSEKRKSAIRARLKNGYAVKDFEQIFRAAEESDFLSGRKAKWKAGFDWLINENNMIKVLEGNYSNENQCGGTQTEKGTDRSGDCDYSKFFSN